MTDGRPIPRSGAADVLKPPPDASPARRRIYQVVFGHESSMGRLFDVALIAVILLSVAAVLVESIPRYRSGWGPELRTLEWIFTGVFTVEYVVRLWCVGKPGRYARSFFGLVDLAAILPSFLSLVLPGGQVLAVVRILRVLRVFRILKLAHYVGEANLLGKALRASRYKITVFLFTVVTIVVVVGSVMYLVEGPENGFVSIPAGMYWAVVTLTTVGFGDITPRTGWGQLLASCLMIMGYGIIAVPTGIVTAELTLASKASSDSSASPDDAVCPDCRLDDHGPDAIHCRRCGAELIREVPDPT